MNALKMPADRMRYEGWKIVTGVSSSPSAAPCPTEKSRTASSTMLEITTSSAARRSTYSTIPNGIGQPPTDTAIACPDESTVYSSTAAIASTRVSVTTDTPT